MLSSGRLLADIIIMLYSHKGHSTDGKLKARLFCKFPVLGVHSVFIKVISHPVAYILYVRY